MLPIAQSTCHHLQLLFALVTEPIIHLENWTSLEHMNGIKNLNFFELHLEFASQKCQSLKIANITNIALQPYWSCWPCRHSTPKCNWIYNEYNALFFYFNPVKLHVDDHPSSSLSRECPTWGLEAGPLILYLQMIQGVLISILTQKVHG